MFANISEFYLAKIFVYAKEEKIKKILGLDILDTYTAADIIYKFIMDNKDNFFEKNSNKYNLLFDEIFFVQAIDVLKNAQKNGKNLNRRPKFSDPHITFVS